MRIIAGTLRGRRLTAPRGMSTRPTTDRVREAWFSILGPLEGQVVDLYAGTGALGFEALSRGAERVLFIEQAPAAQKAILENARSLGVSERVQLLGLPVERAGKQLQQAGPFDLVLTDPPWTSLASCEKTLVRLLQAPLFQPGGRLVLGHPRKQPVLLPEENGLQCEQTRSWGDSAATFYSRAKGEASL